MKAAIQLSAAGLVIALLTSLGLPQAASTSSGTSVRYDGADWKLKGDGIVCCPCAVPCPCRTNAPASYGHCESTLYLRVKSGNYGSVDLSGTQLVRAGGMCAVDYEQLSALYFDDSATPAQREALMKLMASFSPSHVINLSHMRAARFDVAGSDDHILKVIIPGALDIDVDRSWGQPSPPFPMVAAQDELANSLQYAQNIRYRMTDREAGLDFNYSRRQANYRSVDLSIEQYRSKSMLIQFADGSGWFSAKQMELIRAQHLDLPQIDEIRKQAHLLSTPPGR